MPETEGPETDEPVTDWGAVAQDWLDRLAQCSSPGPGVTRLPFTPEHRAALDVLRALMEQAGLTVSLDAAGTLIGRQEGPGGAPTLLMGSHQDSVREGGAYDGIMGVVLPVLALMKLRSGGHTLPFAVEVLAFADEEGVRFPTALMGPRALAGTFDMAALEMCDRDGISLRNAMIDFGLEPDALKHLRRDAGQIIGWIEIHLEQGPVLEAEAQPLGIVSGICGIERHALSLTGQAAHAGTMPMHMRHDALAGASELVLAVEALARSIPGLLATVGALQIRPGVVNAVPGEVSMTVEIRAPVDETRQQAGDELMQTARDIAGRRGLGLVAKRTYAQAATPCDARMVAHLSRAVQGSKAQGSKAQASEEQARGGADAPILASGATHDTSAMADLCPVGMLFTACRNGTSHHPEEHVAPAAMSAGIDALERLMLQLARDP